MVAGHLVGISLVIRLLLSNSEQISGKLVCAKWSNPACPEDTMQLILFRTIKIVEFTLAPKAYFPLTSTLMALTLIEHDKVLLHGLQGACRQIYKVFVILIFINPLIII